MGARPYEGPVRRSPLRHVPTLRRLAVAVPVTLAALGLSGSAFAAVVTPAPAQLGSGTVAVQSCGALTGAVVSYAVTATRLTSVTITGLPASCDGAQLSLTLGATVTPTSSGPLTIAGGAVTAVYPGLSGPLAATVNDVQIAVVG